MEYITKFVISQVFGIGAAITSYLLCQETAGTTPLVVPVTAWLVTSLATILKI